MDVTPLIREGRQAIEAYGDGGFRVSGTPWKGSVLITPQRTLSWAPQAFGQITLESLSPLIEADDPIQVLLLGCGKGAQLPSKDFRANLRDHGIVIEPMDTGAAARTYNVLMAEERAVAAALIAVQ